MRTSVKTVAEWRIEQVGEGLVLFDAKGLSVEGGVVSRAVSRRLSDLAFERGATSVRHTYDLRLTEL